MLNLGEFLNVYLDGLDDDDHKRINHVGDRGKSLE